MDEILMEFNKSDTSDFSDFYEDRKIFFDKEVTPSFVQDTIMWLMRWECEDLGVAMQTLYNQWKSGNWENDKIIIRKGKLVTTKN